MTFQMSQGDLLPYAGKGQKEHAKADTRLSLLIAFSHL